MAFYKDHTGNKHLGNDFTSACYAYLSLARLGTKGRQKNKRDVEKRSAGSSGEMITKNVLKKKGITYCLTLYSNVLFIYLIYI